MDDKRATNLVTGYLIGQSIRKALEVIIAITIMVLLWCVPLYLIDFLPMSAQLVALWTSFIVSY